MPHALLYIRKSVVRTGSDAISPERQRELCLAEARRHGWAVNEGDIYVDAQGHMSGRTEDRPAWRALRRRLARDPDVAAVIVESLSRASRSVRDFFGFLDQCSDRHVILISLKERFDTSGAMGQAMAGVIAVFNQLESDLASERQTDRIAARKADGRHWGLTPFGCDREAVTGALTPSALTYPYNGGERRYHDSLRAAYDLYSTGSYGQAALADALNADGWRYRNRAGRPAPWDAQRVRNVLILHRLYGGEVALSGHVKDGGAQDWIPANFAPILPPELCQRVAAMLARRRHLPHPTPPPLAPTAPSAYPLTGLLFCAECGQPMKGSRRQRPDGSVDRYYRHRFARGACPVTAWTPADGIEAAVGAALSALLIPAEIMDTVIHELLMAVATGTAEGLAEDLAAAEADITRAEAEIQQLLHLALDSGLDAATYRPVLTERQRALAALRARYAELLLAREHEAGGMKKLAERLSQLTAGALSTDDDALRTMARAVFARLEVRGGELSAHQPQDWCRPFF